MRRPPEYQTAAICMLISGLSNVTVAVMWMGLLIWLCVGVLWIVPFVLGFLEIFVAVRMLNGHPQHGALPTAGVGLAASVVNMNPIGFATEIAALVLLASPGVRGWLEADDAYEDF